MPSFDSSGVEIHYVVEGEGPPIVLFHGFAVSLELNWRVPGIIDALVGDGRQVIALDARGHGKSGKPHEPAAYENNAMQRDAIALMDYLGIAKADLAGYSMGAISSIWLLLNHQERFNSVILSGIGGAILTTFMTKERTDTMAAAMESKDGSSPNEMAQNFRILAERTGNDLAALAAMQRAPRSWAGAPDFSNTYVPVLVLAGDEDVLAASADKLAAAIPGARHVSVPGNHMTAPVQPQYKQAMLDFLAQTSPVPKVAG